MCRFVFAEMFRSFLCTDEQNHSDKMELPTGQLGGVTIGEQNNSISFLEERNSISSYRHEFVPGIIEQKLSKCTVHFAPAINTNIPNRPDC